MCNWCSRFVATILVFITNFIWFIVGITLLLLGILRKAGIEISAKDVSSNNGTYQLTFIPNFAIALGVILLIISFLGCFGVLTQNSYLLIWCGALLFVLFLLHVSLGIYSFIKIRNKENLKATIADHITHLFDTYDVNKQNAESLDYIQQTFQCCGTIKPWVKEPPSSCYPNKSKKEQIFEKKCDKYMPEYVMGSVKIIAIVATTVLVIEIFGAVLACCLANCIRYGNGDDDEEVIEDY